MRTGDLFFIFFVLLACCIAGIVALAYHPADISQTPDSFGNAPSDQTNRSAELVTSVTTTETNYTGYFIIFAAVVIIIVIILAFMYNMRKSKLGGGRYRTG